MNSCYIIAEAGVNHNGSEEIAIKLIQAAAESGADAVKFQTFKAENLVSKESKTAEYQKLQTGEDKQYFMLKKLEISEELHIKLMNQCKKSGIEFLSTPFDIESAKFLLDLGMRKIKVPSGELTNIPYIIELAKFDIPMIISTGMSNLDEIKNTLIEIKNLRKVKKFKRPLCEMITILHCTSNYPAKNKDINLRAMKTIEKEFNVPVGYSDHTEGLFVSVNAVAMGATIIEKHFTLNKDMSGPDHKASLEPEELKEMISQIRRIEECLGSEIKSPTENEMPIRSLMRRSVVLTCDKKANEVLKLEDLELLRPGHGIAPVDMKKVVGKKLLVDCKIGTTLKWNDLK
ncbi:N-acetylneuraminate synthase [Methylophilaceae bacterium]|nr:N-acetylneuraminate synthase [Methylophilaceae bacterium]